MNVTTGDGFLLTPCSGRRGRTGRPRAAARRRRAYPTRHVTHHQPVRSRQHFGRRRAPDRAIAAGSVRAAVHRREPGRRRRPGRRDRGRARRAGWLHAAGDRQFAAFRRGALQEPADRSDEGLHPHRPDRQLSFVHRVRADLPINSIQELVDYAKKNPGKLTYGHGNNMGQMIGETLKRRTGVDIAPRRLSQQPRGDDRSDRRPYRHHAAGPQHRHAACSKRQGAPARRLHQARAARRCRRCRRSTRR